MPMEGDLCAICEAHAMAESTGQRRRIPPSALCFVSLGREKSCTCVYTTFCRDATGVALPLLAAFVLLFNALKISGYPPFSALQSQD